MKNIWYLIVLAVIFVLVGWFSNTFYSIYNKKPLPSPTPVPTPFAKYTIENLIKADVNEVSLKIEKEIKTNDNFTSYLFFMKFTPAITGNDQKQISGQINIPKGDGKFPGVVMYRGYADPSIYYTGLGTQRVAEVLAENGFITLSPDFLGYAASDTESGNIFETRFQTYTTAIASINALKNVQNWDGKNIFIWAHSNGGQIALTTLEATGADYPTVLWAPVSKPFPYSILYYTDDASDGGKFLRHETADFENIYDSNQFSLVNYLEKINAPIQLNQGGKDDAVPLVWSDSLSKKLKLLKKDITYLVYPASDHNMMPEWNTAVENALSFYRSRLK